MRRSLNLLGSVVVFLAAGACSDITAPRLLTTFEWGEVADASTIVEGISTTVALGDFFVVGEFPTPSLCFQVSPDFERRDGRLTIRIRAAQTGATNCAQTPGGFRYTASVTNLDSGTWTLRVVHEATGNEFTEDFIIP